MTASAEEFYDQLTPFYHLIFADWDESMRRQGEALESILRQRGLAPRRTPLAANPALVRSTRRARCSRLCRERRPGVLGDETLMTM